MKPLNSIPSWRWMERFLNEKEYDVQAQLYEFECGRFCHALIDGDVMLEALRACPEQERTQIRDILVKIDFHNGDIHRFFTFLAKQLIDTQK